MEQQQLFELLEKSRAGDRQAQEKLVEETQNRVYYHCKKMLKNEDDALDATQDVLIVMLTSLDKLREPAAFWGWVNGITANRCKHLLTQGTREWQIPEDEEGNSLLDDVEDLDEQVVPDKAIDNAETRRLVMEIIDVLPPEQKMAVLFYYYDEMPVKEIAAAMEVSEGTVKSRLNYARKSIKEGVEELEKKGTKLYGVSPLPFLAYFLRMGAESQVLSPAAAAALTQGAMAAGTTAAGAGAGTAAGTAAATAGAGTTAGTATATAAATGAKAAGAVSTKIIAAALAGTIAVGGVGAGVYVATHQEPEPSSTPVVPAVVITTPTPTPEPTDPPIPAICGQVYGPKVLELSQALGDGALYGLAYINEDDIPELTVSQGSDNGEWRFISVYSITLEGELCDTAELTSGLRSGVFYYPGANIVKESGISGPATGATAASYSRMNDSGRLEEFFSSTGEDLEEPTPPPEVEGLQPAGLEGSLTAQEMLDLLGYVPTSPEPTPTPEPTPAAVDEDFVIEDGVLVRYKGPGGDVVVPDGVTSIGNHAFIYCRSLTSVTIPSGVSSIGYYAFEGCQSLTSVALPDGLTFIDHNAFSNCTALTDIALPDSLTFIDCLAFENCGFTSITIPNGMTSIGDRAFASTALTSVTIPTSVTAIEESAFHGCKSLTRITIPGSVTTIGPCAFEGCTSLTDITLSEGLTAIGHSAFYRCSDLTDITIPRSVTTIGKAIFGSCPNLTNVTILSGDVTIDDWLFEQYGIHVTLYAPAGSTTETYAQQNYIPFVALEG